ncbi:MAG TPA: peroxiredoxin-like family protein [Methylomirabilota bacterium]|nr:peroxiredoxin-like family protein [Methylomirabilota bacterium]
MAGLAALRPRIRAAGAEVVVVGPARPEHIADFRRATGWEGPLFVDPSCRTYKAAGLAYGWTKTFHPLTFLKGLRAFAAGFRQGARRGNSLTQGGTFVLGPGERVLYEWRDRFAGDHPPLDQVLAALAPTSAAAR